jgi:alpha-ketoglutarate-dependent taurine dioxygenase
MNYVINKPDASCSYPVIRCGTEKSITGTDVSVIQSLFIEFGVVLFRGFSFNQHQLNALTSQYCFAFVMNKQPGRQRVSGDGRTQSVNLSPVAFPLHPEMSQVPWRPDIAWFACASAPAYGGETTLCDGVAIADNLHEETRAYLETRSFLYKKKATNDECEFWTGITNPTAEKLKGVQDRSPFKFSIEDGVLFKSFITPVLYRPMHSGKLAFGSFLLFRRILHKKYNFPTFEDGSIVPDSLFNEINSAANNQTVAHKWQANDILMVDNTRYMHGRRSIENENQRRIATQFGYSNFRSDHEKLKLCQPWRDNPSLLGSEYLKL